MQCLYTILSTLCIFEISQHKKFLLKKNRNFGRVGGMANSMTVSGKELGEDWMGKRDNTQSIIGKMSKGHRNQFDRVSTSQIWDNLSMKIIVTDICRII